MSTGFPENVRTGDLLDWLKAQQLGGDGADDGHNHSQSVSVAYGSAPPMRVKTEFDRLFTPFTAPLGTVDFVICGDMLDASDAALLPRARVSNRILGDVEDAFARAPSHLRTRGVPVALRAPARPDVAAEACQVLVFMARRHVDVFCRVAGRLTMPARVSEALAKVFSCVCQEKASLVDLMPANETNSSFLGAVQLYGCRVRDDGPDGAVAFERFEPMDNRAWQDSVAYDALRDAMLAALSPETATERIARRLSGVWALVHRGRRSACLGDSAPRPRPRPRWR